MKTDMKAEVEGFLGQVYSDLERPFSPTRQ